MLNKDFHSILKKHGFKPRNKGAFGSWVHNDNLTRVGFMSDGKAYLSGHGGTFTFSKPEILDNYLANGKHLNKSKRIKESTNMKQLIESAINKDAVSFKEHIAEELKARMADILETQLDEVSQGTLKSYSKHSQADAVKQNKTYNRAKSGSDEERTAFRKYLNRREGIQRADRLSAVSESQEQLDEVSNKTLSSYIMRATHDAAARRTQGDKLRDLSYRVKDTHDISNALGKNDKVDNLRKAQYDVSKELEKEADKHQDKAIDRHTNILKAMKKIKN